MSHPTNRAERRHHAARRKAFARFLLTQVWSHNADLFRRQSDEDARECDRHVGMVARTPVLRSDGFKYGSTKDTTPTAVRRALQSETHAPVGGAFPSGGYTHPVGECDRHPWVGLDAGDCWECDVHDSYASCWCGDVYCDYYDAPCESDYSCSYEYLDDWYYGDEGDWSELRHGGYEQHEAECADAERALAYDWDCYHAGPDGQDEAEVLQAMDDAETADYVRAAA